MKLYKDLSINWKVGSLFLILLVLSSVDLVSVFLGGEDNLNALAMVADQNNVLSQQIVLYGVHGQLGDAGAKEKLTEAISFHEKNLELIKNGGLMDGEKHFKATGLNGKMGDQIARIESVWAPLKENVLNMGAADSLVKTKATANAFQNVGEILLADQTLYQSILSLTAQKERFNTTITICIVMAIILLIFLSMYIVDRYVSRPVRRILPVFMDMSNGILGEKIPQLANDEIGSLTGSFNRMNDNLARIMQEISTGSDSIVQGSVQISDASQMLSQGASEQAASAEEVSSAIEEMTANIQQNAENAKHGDQVFSKAGERMQNMAGSTQETLAAIKNITDKIAIINDIAYQTNILALNAAVEASRAGDQGRGFAVVASEVRKLAERSKLAADEIMALSRNTLSTTEKTEILAKELAGEFDKSARMIKEIAATSTELTTGADQINTAIQQMNQVTQQNAAASEELATSAEEFSSQAEQLKDIVGYFSLGKGGKRTGNAKLIEWGPQYYIGIEEIDSQHKVLVDIINKLYASFGSSSSKKELKRNLDELIDYTVFHFGNEENYFRSFGYKDTQAHIEQHKKFVDKVKGFAKEFEKGDSTVSLDIINFLKDWLVNHILKIDTRYVAFFKEHGIR